MRMLKKVVIGILLYWLIFVTAMIVIFCIKSSVPDTLIQYALGGGAIELLATSLIEIFKHKYDLSAGGGDDIPGENTTDPYDLAGDADDRPEDADDRPEDADDAPKKRPKTTSTRRKTATSSKTKRKTKETEDKE